MKELTFFLKDAFLVYALYVFVIVSWSVTYFIMCSKIKNAIRKGDPSNYYIGNGLNKYEDVFSFIPYFIIISTLGIMLFYGSEYGIEYVLLSLLSGAILFAFIKIVANNIILPKMLNKLFSSYYGRSRSL